MAKVDVVEKFAPELSQVGNHRHDLIREEQVSGNGGPHRHAFLLPDGALVWTEVDGEHAHPLTDATADVIEESGEHRHRIGDVETEADGAHGHELRAVDTAWDGGHQHELKLADGVTLVSLSPGELWEAMGSPEQEDLGPPEDSDPALAMQEEPTSIQTVLFDPERFTAEEARAWLDEHDMQSGKLDETEGALRFRQREPDDFEGGSFRIITLTEGVQAVIGRLRKSRVDKARQRSTEYLEAILDIARKTLPGPVWARLHAAAFPSSGGRARRGRGATALERLAIDHIDEAVAKDMTDDDLLGVWSRLHAMHAATLRAKEPVEALVKVARVVRAQLEERGRKLGHTLLAKHAIDPITIRLLEADEVQKHSDVRPVLCQADDEDEPKRVIYAVAMEPDVEDAHGEQTTAENIEAAAWGFLSNAHAINVEHRGPDVDAEVVESFIAPSDLDIGGTTVRKASWVVGIRLSRELFARAQKGDFGGVSVEGLARRVTT